MPKFFVVSDVHSFYTPMMYALDDVGFDPNNENHWFISCGDLFDRGTESSKLLEYVESLPRKVLVKGNHEYLLQKLLERGYPLAHDDHNMTTNTVMDFGLYPYVSSFQANCILAKNRTEKYFNNLVNYFETNNYIFVHSFLPTVEDDSGLLKIPTNWRDSSCDWEDAAWVNPFEFCSVHKQDLDNIGKTLVFGHWHTSWARQMYYGIDSFSENADFSIFYKDNYIALDGCTAYTGKVNVLVIDDEFI